LSVRLLTEADAGAYRALRLRALSEHPEAFTASAEAEAAHPEAWFAERIATGPIYGGWHAGALAGMAGFFVREGAKLAHKGVLWGMYVAPEARGSGLGKALIAAVIAHARGRCEELTLGVWTDNKPALALYRAMGFVECGFEARLLKLDGRYYDETWMSIRFD
jgi:ribosomal protein S18 acetylase RimI-like enzyme